ncbi:hypothetical protein BJY04DRAFT_89142 [Aspergillus karnatakaensis]|uniref:uncharacterized protein n=1 Tax=Aspergillus karnatakaensis TaxID=1810916 RepID=UPI003CCCC9C9
MFVGAPPSRRADMFALGCVFSEILTVLSGFTLERFLAHRSAPHVSHPNYFSGNLPTVIDWLCRLRDTGAEHLIPLFECTMDMLEEGPGQRATADQVRRDLLRSEYKDTFFCSLHLF